MARKLNKNLVALSSAAIVAVYAVGLARSDADTPEVAAGPTASPIAQTATQPSPEPTPTAVARAVARAIASATPSPAAGAAGQPPAVATSPAPSASVRYQDGTFTGSGTSRFGGFDVAVTIRNGAISSVELTRVTTRYPASRIAGLPGQVIERQSADVDLVSGATYSARAFKDAVAQALAKAAAGASQG
jgi:uncharacterized protein with FMN-binding domain